MNINNQTESRECHGSQVIKMNLCKDGYVRLTPETFKITQLVHLVSGLDADSNLTSQEGGSLASISGYTEWVTSTMPAITLGWDWWLDSSQGKVVYVRLGAPRSNVMFIDTIQCDLGYGKTSALLVTAIDALAWSEEVQKHIVTRYV